MCTKVGDYVRRLVTFNPPAPEKAIATINSLDRLGAVEAFNPPAPEKAIATLTSQCKP